MRKCILFMFIFSSVCNVFGQKERSVKIYATIQDYVLHTTIEDVKVTFLSPDSVALDSCLNDNGYITLRKLYRFNVKEGNYIIKTEKEGYETTYTPIEVSNIRRRETNRVLSTIYMKRPKVHAIDEVVVTATKVKFYNKGDTVVYNADAFQLAEGSMLDALVKQLPGVELKSDGRIYVNGRFVESLLLNGKDFFKGDNTIMLENLPTYAVNTVKVYDKTGRLSEFLGRDMNDKQLVMDVNLKKQYTTSDGWATWTREAPTTTFTWHACLPCVPPTTHASPFTATSTTSTTSPLQTPMTGHRTRCLTDGSRQRMSV